MRLHNYILCLAVLLLSVQPVKAETIILAADQWCPYNCDTDNDLEGYVVEIAREIFESSGIDVDYRVMGWKRAVEEARDGRVTAIIGTAVDEAEGFVFPEEEISADAFAFYVRIDDTWRYRTLDSLLGKRIGIPNGYLMAPEMEVFFKDHEDEIEIYYAGREAPTRQNLRLLLAGRLDAILDDASVIVYVAHSLGLQQSIAYAGNDGYFEKLYVAFSPANPKSTQYVSLFDKGIRELRSSGRLKAILHKYGLADWKKSNEPASAE